MEEFIARLLDLQDLDRRIDRLKADGESIPGEIAIHRRDIEGHRSRFRASEEQLISLKEEQKKLAADRAETLAKISDYKSRLLTLKSNEEYSAMLKQISHGEKLVDQIDDRILEAMYKEDEIRGELERAEKEKDRAINRSEAREQLLKKKLEEIESQLEQLQIERAQAAERVDPKHLKRYEITRESRHREVVTGIRNGACGSCLTKIPAQAAGEIKGGSTFSCPICGSFVVWTPDSSL